LIGLLAFIQNLTGSSSVFIHHIFPHIGSILIIIYVAKITVELGGKNKAIFLALLCIIIAPGFGRSQQLFQPVVFSQLFWVLSFFQLTRFVKFRDSKSLWYLTAFAVLGFSVKYDALFFIFGLSALLFFKTTRQALIQHQFWKNIMVAAVVLLPNFIWQYTNDFPALKMFDRLYETQLDSISRTDSLMQLLIEVNPLTSLWIVLPGLAFMFYKWRRQNLPLAVSIVLSACFLLLLNGKPYYFYPLILTIIPFGALFWERLAKANKKWMVYLVTAVLLPGALLIPFGMPVYDLDNYLAKIYPYEKKEVAGGKYAVSFEEYYSEEKWRQTMQQLHHVHDSLSANEKENCLIWGKHYKQAGAVNLFGPKYGLPSAFSYHGSFFNWSPNGQMPNTIVAFRDSQPDGKDFFEPFFEEVIPVSTIYNPYAKKEDELYQTIFICRKPKQDFDRMKQLFEARIFE
ncbi:MAG: glycosyltransferase family 39 protein, partial [Flavobacterium sp.]|nr:glycosyltransferase family 39 protein [Flavobacterium sp.]